MHFLLFCLFFLTLTFQTYPTPAHHLETQKRITIIGAGLAGLTTAYRLETMGYLVEIYEARARPGGRVLTAYFDDGCEELGGRNVYDGGNGENILALISELSLDTESREVRYPRLILFEGKLINQIDIFKDAPAPTAAALNALREKIYTVRSLGDLIDPFIGENKPLRQFIEMSMKGWEGSSSYFLSPEFVEGSFWDIYQRHYAAVQDVLVGQVAKKTLRYVKGGNSQLIKTLVEKLQSPIHYNHPLRMITKTSDQKVWLHFDHKSVATDYLVLALPCSTLREVEIEQGILPVDQISAIETLQYGTNAEIIFPIELASKLPAEFIQTENWNAFFNNSNTILTSYFGGEPGIFDAYCTECMTDLITREYTSFLNALPMIKFPKGIIPTMPRDEMFVHYDKPVAISWALEEFSKGSYSNYGLGTFTFFNEFTEDHGETVRKVFRSVDDKIFFAGEHTAPEGDHGTMDGAVYSGERAARMLSRIEPLISK